MREHLDLSHSRGLFYSAADTSPYAAIADPALLDLLWNLPLLYSPNGEGCRLSLLGALVLVYIRIELLMEFLIQAASPFLCLYDKLGTVCCSNVFRGLVLDTQILLGQN